MRFVVDEVALRHVSFRPLRFSTVSEIPPIVHTHLYLNTVKDKRAKPGELRQSSALSEIWEHLVGNVINSSIG